MSLICRAWALLVALLAVEARVRLLRQSGDLTRFPQTQQALDDTRASAAAANQKLKDMMAKHFDPLLLSRLQASRLDSASTTLNSGPSPSSELQPSPSPTSSVPKQPPSTPKQPKSAPKQPEGKDASETKPLSASEPAKAGNDSLKDTVLSAHNTLRARHQASPLSWSSSLAAEAQSWASNCEWGHSDAEEGENLAIGYPSVQAAMQVWAEEEKRYQYGEVTPNMAHFQEIGHFTQMVWRSTTDIGCATAQCTWKGRDATYFVCRYRPAGNVLGQFADNVKPPE